MAVRKGIPANSSIVMPRLFCRDPAAEMDFCAQTFRAVELNRRLGPDGTVAHGLLSINGEMIMVESEWPGFPSRAPQLDGSSSVGIFVYVDDVDAAVERAVNIGAKILYPVQNQFWGDRTGWVMDPQGHVWTIASRIEETSKEECDRRWSDILQKSNAESADSNYRDGATVA
jgi:PhnB protein